MLLIQLLGLVGALTAQYNSYNYGNTGYYPTDDKYPTDQQYPTDGDKGSYPSYPEAPKQEKFGSDIKNTSSECQSTLERVREAIGNESIKDCFPEGSLYFDSAYTGCKPNCVDPIIQLNSKIVDGCFTRPEDCNHPNSNEGVNLDNYQNSTNTIYHQWQNPKLVKLACQMSSQSQSYCIKELQQSFTKLQNSRETGYPVRSTKRICTNCAKYYVELNDYEVGQFPTSYFGQIESPSKFRDELKELCNGNYNESEGDYPSYYY